MAKKLRGASSAGVASTPTVENGTLYCGTANSLIALNTSNGKDKWSYNIGSVVTSSPCAINGVVYFMDDAGNSYAVDTTDNLKWKLAQYNSSYYGSASFTYNNNILYKVTHSYPITTIIRALNAGTGSVVWNDSVVVNNFSNGSEFADPYYFKNILYARLTDSLIAYDGLTGNKKWSYPLPNDPYDAQRNYSGPCAVPGIVYTTDREHTLYAINSKNGTLIWSFYYGGAYFPAPFVLLNNGKSYYPSISGMIQ